MLKPSIFEVCSQPIVNVRAVLATKVVTTKTSRRVEYHIGPVLRFPKFQTTSTVVAGFYVCILPTTSNLSGTLPDLCVYFVSTQSCINSSSSCLLQCLTYPPSRDTVDHLVKGRDRQSVFVGQSSWFFGAHTPVHMLHDGH